MNTDQRKAAGVRPQLAKKTDLGNAQRLVARNEELVRYVDATKTWHVWDGAKWAADDTGAVDRLARDTVRAMHREAASLPSETDEQDQAKTEAAKWAVASESAARLTAMIQLARFEPGVAVTATAFDSRAWELNCPNGVVDLRTGKLRTHDPAAMHSQSTAVDYRRAAAPVWRKFLKLVLPDPEVRSYVQQLLGASLVGAPLPAATFPFVYGEGGTGKDQPIDTLIATPAGWTAMGSLSVGDYAVGRDGRPTRIVGVYPQGVRQQYRVTLKDGSTTEAGADHLWTVRDRWGAEAVRTTAELRAAGVRNASGNHNWYLPRVGAVEYLEPATPAALPVRPYLLGALLGDGSLTGSTVQFYSAEGECVPLVTAELPDHMRVARYGPKHFGLCGTKYRYNPLMDDLRELGLWGVGAADKRVPVAYLTAPAPDRLSLLQGLMDTDGCACGLRGAEFASLSEGLRDDVAALVRSLGGRAAVSTMPPRAGGKGGSGGAMHRVRAHLNAPLFRLPRKAGAHMPAHKPYEAIVSIEPSRACASQCICVAAPDNNYVTSDFIVTHNSTLLEPVLAAVGDYGRLAPANLLAAKRGSEQTYDIAALRGARFVLASEGHSKQRLAEDVVKRITGDASLAGRQIREAELTFPNVTALWFMSNHEPRVSSTDTGLWRRIKEIPMEVVLGPEHAGLKETLIDSELEGILAWCVAGCVAWQKLGAIAPPAAVLEATDSYRNDANPLLEWVEQACVADPEGRHTGPELHASFVEWAAAGRRYNDYPSGRSKNWARALKSLGLEPVRTATYRGYQGLKLRQPAL